MVACRFDRRLAARVDPSDVVQVVLTEANQKLDLYIRDRPLPFYPWLRQLAWEHLALLHRPADQAGAEAWTRALSQGSSRDAVALAILLSPEAEQTTIDGWYRDYLWRPADAAGLQAFTTALQQGMTPEQVRALILASDEYFSRG